jgi:hypothetical protein
MTYAAKGRAVCAWERLESVIAYFNQTLAKPFRWTKTGKPLAA